MMARFRISLMTAALMGLAILGAGRPAEAAFRLILSDLEGNDETINDNSGTGWIIFGPVVVGNFTVGGQAQAPPLASQSLPAGTLSFSQSTFTITSAGAGSLFIRLEVDGMNLPASAATLVSSIGNSRLNGESYSFQSFFDVNNVLGQTAGLGVTATPVQGPFTADLATSNVVKAPISPTSSGPFSVANVLEFVATGASQSLTVTGTTQVVAVPEPANIAMAGTAALLSLSALRRRAHA